MEITGRHRVPAAASRLWEALSDRRTVGRCLPDGVALAPLGDEGGPLLDLLGRTARIATVATEASSRASFRLSPDRAGQPGWAALLDATLVEEGPFTLVAWRWLAEGEAPDADRLRTSVDTFLERIGQHAAVPVTIAAEGLSGVAAGIAEAVPPARETPFGPTLARIRAWPRDLAIGGALFAVVLLIVIGIV